MPATPPPATIWVGAGQERGVSDGSNIDSEAGLDLITESSNTLVIDDGSATSKPASVWVEIDNT